MKLDVLKSDFVSLISNRMKNLPPEVLFMVFRYLSFEDFIAFDLAFPTENKKVRWWAKNYFIKEYEKLVKNLSTRFDFKENDVSDNASKALIILKKIFVAFSKERPALTYYLFNQLSVELTRAMKLYLENIRKVRGFRLAARHIIENQTHKFLTDASGPEIYQSFVDKPEIPEELFIGMQSISSLNIDKHEKYERAVNASLWRIMNKKNYLPKGHWSNSRPECSTLLASVDRFFMETASVMGGNRTWHNRSAEIIIDEVMMELGLNFQSDMKFTESRNLIST